MPTTDKAIKFIDLANKRVNRAIKDLKLIGNLSNRKNYEFTDEQAKKIIRALQKEIDLIKQSFENNEKQNVDKFKL